jgi:hypothetical protein
MSQWQNRDEGDVFLERFVSIGGDQVGDLAVPVVGYDEVRTAAALYGYSFPNGGNSHPIAPQWIDAKYRATIGC